MRESTLKLSSNTELKDKYAGLLREPLAIHDVIYCNHKPHPIMIGTRHVDYAADHCGGMLGKETLRRIPCAWKGCTTAYKDHTSDRVLILRLTRNASQEEAHAVLKSLADSMAADGLDGVTFLKNSFTFIEASQPCNA